MAVEFEILEHIAEIGKKGKWAIEVNRIRWNNADAKIDIRRWSEDHEKMGKGITLTDEEAAELKAALEKI